MSRKRAIKILIRATIVAAVGFVLAAILIVISGMRDDIKQADVGVVLGNTVEPDGQPSARLRARLDKALELYRAGLFADVIVSGGIGKEGFDEAAVMKQYLTANGVPEERVHTDSQGLDTYRTARNTAEQMAARGWSSALVVSQFFHVPRCRLALKRCGIQLVYSAHANYFELRDIYSIGREVVAYVSYSVRSFN